jgi:hypothetical protein
MVQIRKMNLYDDASDDGDDTSSDCDYYPYCDSDGDWHYYNGAYDHADDDEDDDDESIESVALHRRNIINGLHASSLQHLSFSDELWESSVTMESFQPDGENIIVALQSNRSLETIVISGEVLAAIGESDQRRLFCSVGNLPTLQRMSLYVGAGSPTAIHTRVLADALSETSNDLKLLQLSEFKISSRSEVEQLVHCLRARVESLNILILEDIVLCVEDKTGFLDPILLALAPAPGEPCGQLSCFEFSCVEAASNRVSVVSPEALRALFAAEPVEIPSRTFRLNNLGLNNNHCEVMAQELARDDALSRPINELDLTGNPYIGEQGYAALLGLLNRRFNLLVDVDNQNWKTTLDLVYYMNREYHRGRFLRNGVFPFKGNVGELLGRAQQD